MKLTYQHCFFFFLSFIFFSCGPTARFEFQQEEKKAPSKVTFTNDSKKAETYSWDFGDGTSSEEENPEHQYYLSGKYTITLRAIDDKKSKTTSKEIFVEAPDICLVVIETEYGDMLVQLFDETPKHRDNFIKLAEEGFYDGLLFHRVIEGFMIQGGDPDSKKAKKGQPLGSGDPGYQVDAEFNKNLVHVRGALAAARTPDNMNPKRKSSGSQFYIVDGKQVPENQLRNISLGNGVTYTDEQKKIFLEEGGTPFLDMGYTVFGQVLEGFEVIDAIASVKKDNRDRPNDDISMKVRIIK